MSEILQFLHKGFCSDDTSTHASHFACCIVAFFFLLFLLAVMPCCGIVGNILPGAEYMSGPCIYANELLMRAQGVSVRGITGGGGAGR